MGNELQMGSSNGLQLDSLPDIFKFAECLVKAGDFIPEHFRKNVSAVAAAIVTGQELGLSPMASVRGLYVVKGKVGVSYDVMVGLLRKHGYHIEWPFKIDNVEVNNAEIATLMLTHKDGTPMKSVYTKEDAIRAGLWGKNTWAAHPKSMLRARAVSNAARAFAGEVLNGIYCMDEVQEIERREEKVVQVNSDSKPSNQTLLNRLKAKNEEQQEVKVIPEDENQESEVILEGEVQQLNVLSDDGVLTGSFITLSDMMDEAKSSGELMEVAQQIKGGNISDEEKEILRAKFSERKQEINKG